MAVLKTKILKWLGINIETINYNQIVNKSQLAQFRSELEALKEKINVLDAQCLIVTDMVCNNHTIFSNENIVKALDSNILPPSKL